MKDAPRLWLIGGPNGGGKSTYAPRLAASVEEIVRPDEIAETLAARPLSARNSAAGRLAIRRIQTLFRERRNFAVETTLAGRRYPQLLVRAKSEGWSTGIAYVGSQRRSSRSSAFENELAREATTFLRRTCAEDTNAA